MTWVLDLPPSDYFTPNSRVHWSKRARCARAWRTAVHMLALQAEIPAQDHVTVALEFFPPDRRRRDADNLVSGVLKHCLDGLVDAGVIVDDSPEFVTARMPVIRDVRDDRQAMWLLTVEAA